MSIGNLLLGALVMYIYLRRKGVDPPSQIRLWEQKLLSGIQSTKEGA